MEIVFVDDGSIDGTRAVVERLSPKVAYLPVSHGGVSAARNAGISATRGAFVAFLDHDDLWDARKIEKQVALMTRHRDLGLVFTRARVSGDPAHPPVIPPPGGAWERLFVDGAASGDTAVTYATLLQENFVPLSTILARRSSMPVDGFRADLRYSEDHDFLLRMAELKRFGFLDETLATYTIRPGRATERMADMRLEDIAIFRETLERHPWLPNLDPRGIRRRHQRLLREAGYWLLREGRSAEARPLLKEAWRMNPLDLKLPAYLIASMRASTSGRSSGQARRG
jgi:glycosyltransferase involved in cell wall biosynthesis